MTTRILTNRPTTGLTPKGRRYRRWSEWTEEQREKRRAYARAYQKKNMDKMREYRKRYIERNPEKHEQIKKINAAHKLSWKRKPENVVRYYESMKRFHLKRGYGMTLEEYRTQLAEQDYKCAICAAPHLEQRGGRLHVDHCHKTKKRRGLLCHDCNVMLGRAGAEGDDVDILRKAANYLEKYLY